MLRTCRDCGLIAHDHDELILFKKSKTSKHGRDNYCKKCSYGYNKANMSKYYKEYRVDYDEENKELQKVQKRNARLKSNYGIDLNMYEEMYKNQEGKCYTCHTEHDTLAVDHNHTTGEVRALLCKHCNTALGFSKENKKILENLIKYIDKFN